MAQWLRVYACSQRQVASIPSGHLGALRQLVALVPGVLASGLRRHLNSCAHNLKGKGEIKEQSLPTWER